MHSPIQPITLATICGGAAEEVFQRELAELLKNVTDPNTTAEAKRRIVLTFDFSPLSDRTGSSVSFACQSKLAPVTVVKSSIFLSRQGEEVLAFATDTRQQPLFPAEGGGGEPLATQKAPEKLVVLKKS